MSHNLCLVGCKEEVLSNYEKKSVFSILRKSVFSFSTRRVCTSLWESCVCSLSERSVCVFTFREERVCVHEGSLNPLGTVSVFSPYERVCVD